MYAYCTISIKRLHALGVELKLLREPQENQLLQLTGDAMATEKAEVQCVQTTRDGGIVALRDHCFACWPSS